MTASDSKLVDYALRLLRLDMICIPLCSDSKHIAFRSMDLPPYHAVTARKHLKNVAYQSLAFNLALRPPGEADLVTWFSGHRGNVGIVAGYRRLIVLDFDDAGIFGDWARQFPDIAGSTPVERSPTGFHVYLACDEPLPCTSLYYGRRKAGHLSALGGYVACSPSQLRVKGVYEWLTGQSPFDVRPASIANLASISMHPAGWVRRGYDRLFGRGSFSAAETMSQDEYRNE